MDRARARLLLLTLGYFSVLLVIAFGLHDTPSETDTLWFTVRDLLDHGIAGLGDPTSYATAGFDIYSEGWIAPEHSWIFNLWPPGFPLLQALLLRTFGSNLPLVTALQVCAAALFAVVLVLVFDEARTVVNSRIAVIVGLVPFLFPVSRAFLLQPTGVSLGETFAIALFLIGLLLSLRGVRLKQIRQTVLAGLCLGASAYFQARFELILSALCAIGFVLFLLGSTRLVSFVLGGRLPKATVVPILVIVLTAQAATVPWRFYHLIAAGTVQWSLGGASEYQNSVRTTDDLVSTGGGFVAKGGGNLTCRLEAVNCGKTIQAEQLFYQTFREHPIEWLGTKAALLNEYWFAPIGQWTEVDDDPSGLDLFANWLLLVMALTAVLALTRRGAVEQPQRVIVIWFAGTIAAAYTVIFSLFHYEARYFYFPKIAMIFVFVIAAIMTGRGLLRARSTPK